MDTSKNEEENSLVFFCNYCDCEINKDKAIQDGGNFYCSDDCLTEAYDELE